jgi:hypothetical protein
MPRAPALVADASLTRIDDLTDDAKKPLLQSGKAY